MRPRLALLLALGLLPLSIVSFSARGAGVDWYRWRGPNLNGISDETGWSSSWSAEGPKRLWKASVGAGFSSVSIREGRVFTLGNVANQDVVIALDAATGKPIWKFAYDCPLDPHYYDGGTSCTPTVDGNVVYTLSRRGHLFAFDAASGKIIWQKNVAKETGAKVPEWGFAGSPLVEGNALIVNIGTAGAAFDKATGSPLWNTGNEPSGYSSAVPMVVDGKRWLVLATHADYTAIDPKSGQVAWKFPWKTEYYINASDPVILGDRVFVSSGYDRGGAVFQVAGNSPTPIWENKELRTQFGGTVYLNGHLFGVDGNDGRDTTLKCIDAATGAVKWSRKGAGMGNLMAADGKLIVQWQKGEVAVVAADPSAYRELSRAQINGGKCWTAPVLSQGRIYSRNAAGDLVCVDVSAR